MIKEKIKKKNNVINLGQNSRSRNNYRWKILEDGKKILGRGRLTGKTINT